MIYIVNKRRKEESIKKEFPNAIILDITSKSAYAKKLSPFYPHGNVPIPNSGDATATCVEAVWQGLKVFEKEGISMETFRNDTMKNIKRTVRKFGVPKGHQYGLYDSRLLGYYEARILIYLPTYKWVLDNIPDVHHIVERIKEQSKKTDIVFLDYNTNIDYRDLTSPLSHAGLVKLYIEGNYPNPSIENAPPSITTKVKSHNKAQTNKKTSHKNKESKRKKEIEVLHPSLFPDLD